MTELFAGRQVSVTSPQGRFRLGASQLDGRTAGESFAVGKHMFTDFGGMFLRVHLGLYGAWDFTAAGVPGAAAREGQTGEYSMGAPRRLRAGETETQVPDRAAVFPPAPVGAVRVRLLTDAACADLRGPTACEVLTPAEVSVKIAQLGPDPLVEPGKKGLERFIAGVAKRRAPIGQVLMDQNAVAGIGNIYRAELLFRAGIDPYAPAGSLSREQLAALWRDWTKLLKLGVKTGVILTRDQSGAARQRALADREFRHWVYGRSGLPCRRCGTPVALAEMQGRKLYWCPACQQ